MLEKVTLTRLKAINVGKINSISFSDSEQYVAFSSSSRNFCVYDLHNNKNFKFKASGNVLKCIVLESINKVVVLYKTVDVYGIAIHDLRYPDYLINFKTIMPYSKHEYYYTTIEYVKDSDKEYLLVCDTESNMFIYDFSMLLKNRKTLIKTIKFKSNVKKIFKTINSSLILLQKLNEFSFFDISTMKENLFKLKKFKFKKEKGTYVDFDGENFYILSSQQGLYYYKLMKDKKFHIQYRKDIPDFINIFPEHYKNCTIALDVTKKRCIFCFATHPKQKIFDWLFEKDIYRLNLSLYSYSGLNDMQYMAFSNSKKYLFLVNKFDVYYINFDTTIKEENLLFTDLKSKEYSVYT